MFFLRSGVLFFLFCHQEAENLAYGEAGDLDEGKLFTDKPKTLEKFHLKQWAVRIHCRSLS